MELGEEQCLKLWVSPLPGYLNVFAFISFFSFSLLPLIFPQNLHRARLFTLKIQLIKNIASDQDTVQTCNPTTQEMKAADHKFHLGLLYSEFEMLLDLE